MRLATLSEKEIIITLIALALLLLFAFCFGTLMEKIKGPRVVGEILGGMILGGSCLFILFPSFAEQVFFASLQSEAVLNVFESLDYRERMLIAAHLGFCPECYETYESKER